MLNFKTCRTTSYDVVSLVWTGSRKSFTNPIIFIRFLLLEHVTASSRRREKKKLIPSFRRHGTTPRDAVRCFPTSYGILGCRADAVRRRRMSESIARRRALPCRALPCHDVSIVWTALKVVVLDSNRVHYWIKEQNTIESKGHSAFIKATISGATIKSNISW